MCTVGGLLIFLLNFEFYKVQAAKNTLLKLEKVSEKIFTTNHEIYL